MMKQKQTLKQRIAAWGLVGLMSLVNGFNTGCVSDEYLAREKTPGTEEHAEWKKSEELNRKLMNVYTGGLLGALTSGAADTGNVRKDIAVRGLAQGVQSERTNEAIRNSGSVNLEVNVSEQQNYQPSERTNDAIRNSGQVNVYNNQNDQKLKYIGFTNLNTGQSIQIMGWDEKAIGNYLDSLYSHIEDFPKKGYFMQTMNGNQCIKTNILTIEILKEYEKIKESEKTK